MGYDKYDIDWSVFGTDKPKKESSGNPMQGSIGKGWSKTNDAALIDDSESASSETETPSNTKNIRITSAKFIPDAETDFLKECKIRIEAQGDPSVAEVALWGAFNGTDYDLRLSKNVHFTDGIAESTLPLEYVDEFYNNYYSDGNSDAFTDYFFYVSCSGAEKKKSDTLRMPLQQIIECDFVEFHDELFHHNCALPSLDSEGVLINSLVAAFKFASENADRELIIEGHADKSGKPDYNLTISKRRAEAIKALVANDEKLWNGVVKANGSDHKIETEDYQQSLKSLATKFSWPCDPGEVDNKKGPETEDAVRKYQIKFNETFPDKEQLSPDGDFGPKSWGSLFFVLRDLLEKGLKTAGLESSATLKYGYPEGDGIYPCGESCSLTGQERSAEDRRVEFVFYKKGDAAPPIAPAAGREIAPKKDPVTEKEWKKKKVATEDLIEDIKITITDIPNRFAPSTESCTIKYRVEDGDPPSGSKGTVEIKDNSGALVFEKKDLQLQKSLENQFVWDGKGSDGKIVPFGKGPFKITVQQTGDPTTKSQEKTALVEIAEIALQVSGLSASNQLVENVPGKEMELFATVYLKKSDGSKAVSQIPIEVEFSFTDPAPANRPEANSFEYATGKFLGKAGNASSIYWKSHPDCTASSSDGYKTKCKVKTICTSGSPDIGKAKVYFIPSNVGGDNFKIKATIYAGDGTTVIAFKESPTVTICRKVKLTAYEMAGAGHVTTHATEAKMNTYYTADTYTLYYRGMINTIGATYSVTYIGLWNHSTMAQRDWAVEQKKLPAEIPIPDEETKANGPAGPDQVTARNAIQSKVDAWRDRIVKNMMDGLNDWATDAGIPANAIVAINYFHPKYNAHAPAADAITNEWSAFPWLRITFKGNTIHPDQRWNQAEASAYQTRAYILNGLSAARYEVAIAHEIGHVTKDQFKRGLFGGGDHSSSPGLMDPVGSLASFSVKEKELLRGYKP